MMSAGMRPRVMTGVRAVFVELDQVGVEVSTEAGDREVEVSREAGSPEFVENRAVQSFDVPVRLGPAGADPCVARCELGERGVEARLELVAVVSEHALEPPLGTLEVFRDALRELARLRRGGSALGQATRLAQAYQE